MAAYYLDRAVYSFGQRYQQEVDAISDSKKSKQAKAMALSMLQQKWLGISRFAGAGKGPTRR